MKLLSNTATLAIINSHVIGTGNGAWTDKELQYISSNYSVDESGALFTPYGTIPELNINQFAAMIIREIDRAVSDKVRTNIIERYADGTSVTGAHYMSLKAGSKATSNTTLVTTRANISALDYRCNAIKLGLQADTIVESILTLIDLARKFDDKTTKATLYETLLQFVSLFETYDQYSVYNTKLADEQASAAKFAALTDAGATNITALHDGSYTTDVTITDLSTVASTLLQHSYELVGPLTSLANSMFRVVFRNC